MGTEFLRILVRLYSPMDVVLTIVGQVVVDDHGNLLNVYTSGEKISGDEDTARTCSKLFHDHFSFCLGHFTVLFISSD